ncbi:MAG: hypothetical protein WCY41_01950 [Candidatus Micrarchaeia archaeon]
MSLSTNRGYAQLDNGTWNEWMHMKLSSSLDSLIKTEGKLVEKERALAPIAARTEKYPLQRLPNGRFISVTKAKIELSNVRKELSSVIEQRRGVQARLMHLR